MCPEKLAGKKINYWFSCAINKGGFIEIAFVSTHLPLFEALAYVFPHFDALTYFFVCPRRSSFKRLLTSAILSS